MPPHRPPSSTGCRDCDECQKSSICSSACCMKDVEIVEQYTSLPPDGTNGKFSMSNCSYQQEVPTNDGDDVIITSHNFSRQDILPVILPAKEKRPLIPQIPEQNPDSPSECVLVSYSNKTAPISDSQINLLRPSYQMPTISGKITTCQSLTQPVIWKAV